MFVWKDSKKPPLIVSTFEVYQTSRFLIPYFEFFRKNLTLIETDRLLSKKKASSISFFSRFISPYSKDYRKLQRLKELFDFWHRKGMAAYPRGSLDSHVIICGIAPGYTREKFYESMWLLGPSSRLLYQNLFCYEVYFTNICKCSFEKNQYSNEKVLEWFDTFYEEVSIIKPRLIIFLGKSYDIYRKLKFKRSIRIEIVEHPAYFLRSSKTNSNRAKKFVRSVIEEHFSVNLEESFSCSGFLFEEYVKIFDSIFQHKEFKFDPYGSLAKSSSLQFQS